jgi:hypothetical protein
MCRLRFFEIDVKLGSSNEDDFNTLSFLMGSLCISLTSPATLEHLKFDITFDDEGKDERFFENLRDADAWRHLDSITSHPTGSRLQRVDINIDYLYGYDYDYPDEKPDKNEVMNAVLDGLPLLRSKGVLFVKAVWE